MATKVKCENGVWNTHALKDSRDGQDYHAIKIGDQVWMAENLNFKTDSSFCYNDEETNCIEYGRLYTWSDAKEACPSGWHLPSKTEWETLFSAVGGQLTAGKVLRSTDSEVTEDDGPGTDDFGFSGVVAFLMSCSFCDDDPIRWEGPDVLFWSSTDIYSVNLGRNSASFRDIANYDYVYYEWNSVRCLKDSAE